ncbi:MAG: hypothetical protein Q4B34_02460 [Candidatus Saccharibacteria bacterium]|nr:hypothetical protein [Candidatus Saccharibacteria bacterium]
MKTITYLTTNPHKMEEAEELERSRGSHAEKEAAGTSFSMCRMGKRAL